MFQMDGSERDGTDIERIIASAEEIACALGLSIRYCADAIMSAMQDFSSHIYAFGEMVSDGIARGLNPPQPEVFSIGDIEYSLTYSCLPRFRMGDLDLMRYRPGLLQPGESRRACYVAPQRSLVLPRYRRSYHRRIISPNRKGSDKS